METLKKYDLRAIFHTYTTQVFREINSFLNSIDNVHNIDEISRSISDYYASDALDVSIWVQKKIMEDFFSIEEDKSSYYKWVLTDEAQGFIRREYPEMDRILRVKCENIIRLVKELVNRFVSDKDKLESSGFSIGNSIHEIIITDSDSHNKGQRVCILATDGGKIVYKPRSLHIDSVVFKIASIVNSNLEGNSNIKIPQSLDCGHYGWQEYIVYKPALTLYDLATYYESLGGLTAFFASIGGYDFHYDNVVSVCNKAVPLDLETALSSSSQDQGSDKSPNIAEIVNHVMSSAGAGTLILPPLKQGARFDVDLSPVTDGLQQDSKIMRSPYINVSKYGNIEILVDDAKFTKTIPHDKSLGKEKTHPRKYIKNFSEGYQRICKSIDKSIPELLSLFRNVTYIRRRCVIRPTSTYAAFLKVSYYPKYLVSYEARASLFERLGFPPSVPSEIGGQALKVERESLIEGDIPYFTDSMLEDFILFSAASSKNKVGKEDSRKTFQVSPIETVQNFASTSSWAADIVQYIHYGSFAGLDDDIWVNRMHEEITPFFDIKLNSSWEDALYNLTLQAQKLLITDSLENISTMFLQVVDGGTRVQTIPCFIL